MSDVSVRVGGVEDAGKIAALFTEFNALLGVDGRPEEASFAPELIPVSTVQMLGRLTRMNGIETTLLAETPNGAAGLCCLRLVPYIGQDEPYAEVTQLYVRDTYKRQGVGTDLLRAAENMARDAGATCVHIITGQANLGAQAFYRAQGYRSDDVVFDKYFLREATHA
jgi:ribosomal protein S18 acetylase RimI-like enzyme